MEVVVIPGGVLIIRSSKRVAYVFVNQGISDICVRVLRIRMSGKD